MHALFVHQNFPAQFGHIAGYLVHQMGWRCTFASELEPANVGGIERVQYKPVGGATVHNSFFSRTYENCIAHTHGVYNALKARPDIKPDVVIGHSGFGSTLFLRELYDAPIINYFEYFYRTKNSDMDFRPDASSGEEKKLRAMARNAMILLDLNNCDAGYCPTGFQRSTLPVEYQPKVRKVFDGVDTRIYFPMKDVPRVVAGRTIPADTRIVTYCARGFEKIRGFDIFMEGARKIYEKFPNVVFVVVGSDRICYGDGEEEKGGHESYRKRVLAEGRYDESKFIFTGNIHPRELAAVMNMGDAHVYLTVPFVLSWSMMNAMACGSLVIGSSTAPVREMVRHGENGLLFDFFNTQELADRTIEVLKDPAAYQPMRVKAAQFIQSRYSLPAVLPQLIDLYESTANMYRGRA